MSCSKEEIERKRLAALQKRQGKTFQSPLKTFPSSPGTSNYVHRGGGRLKTFTNNSHTSTHPYAKPNSSVNNDCKVPVTRVVSGTVYLISEERFEVNPSEFCTPLINIFKTIPSKNYDPKTKLWNFSIDDYQEFISKVSPLAPHIVLGALPNYVLKILQEPTVDPQSIDLSPIEATLRHKLMPFQETGVRFGIAKRGRCLIADDMGLGKTFQALAIASYYRHNWPLLIVTTSSMREIWQTKIHELLPSIPMMNIVCLNTNRDTQAVADRQTEVVICSYKLTTAHGDLLKNKKFGVIVIDESHSLKSPKAQCTRALSSICLPAQRVVLLSGTPALSRPAELYSQLDLLHRKLFGSFTDYGKRYCAGKMTNFGWDMTGQSNLVELQVLLHRKFLIRRTKEQVLDTLEKKTRESIILDESLLQFTAEDRQGLSQMAEKFKATKSTDRHAALLSFYSETARVKIPAICKYIKQFVEKESEKFLVFAHHKAMIDAICQTLDELAVSYICIVGSTPTTQRAELVDTFQLSGSCRCAVLSTLSAGAGLTLTAAGVVIFAELHWNPGSLSQAESRAHRLGRSGAVSVRYLRAPHTADDLLWPMLQGKLNVLNEVGLSRDTYENTTSRLQESKMNITQYMTPVKNKNDYIPGTNIRIDKCDNRNSCNVNENSDNRNDKSFNRNDEENEKSFLEEDEDDELLANLDL